MKALILAGGFGTRLRTLITDVPKPMAPILEKPFLAWLFDYLAEQGITEIVLSVHYLYETIQNYFGTSYKNIDIHYAIEEKPLGTGGAIAFALKKFSNLKEPIIVLNGDTFLKLDYRDFYQQHHSHQAALTIALRTVANCSRYGEVVVEKNMITEFKERGHDGSGFINAGVYLMAPDLFNQVNMPEIFSFEKDFLLPYVNQISPRAYQLKDAYFIDIGVPEDYQRASRELPNFLIA